MFREYDEKIEKQVKGIKEKILKAEVVISDLESKLSFDMDMDEYALLSDKIQHYKSFIKANRNAIIDIKNTPYTKDQLLNVRDKIQKTYNPRLEKLYSKLTVKADELFAIYNEYLEVTEKLLIDRNELNEKARACNVIANIYDGEGIKNDFAGNFTTVINELKIKFKK